MKCNGEGEMQTVYVKRLSHEDISSLVAAVYSKDVSKALFRPAILPRLPRSSIPISISTLEISPAGFHDCIHGRCIVKNGNTRLQALHKPRIFGRHSQSPNSRDGTGFGRRIEPGGRRVEGVFWTDHELLFPNPVMEELPTIRPQKVFQETETQGNEPNPKSGSLLRRLVHLD